MIRETTNAGTMIQNFLEYEESREITLKME